MNYIGSKHKLNPWLLEEISNTYPHQLSTAIFCDLFAGTGAVGRNFKPLVHQVIANDVEHYSYVLLKNYVGNISELHYHEYLEKLNTLTPKKGFIFEHYSEGGHAQRLYFSSNNGQHIDAARQKIEQWKTDNTIDAPLYYFLIASLIESADKVANTASVYGAYLKNLKKSATKKLVIAPAIFTATQRPNRVFNEDANTLIKKISGDILYLDPPYNARQYGANYHLLNTIAHYDNFVPKGKTGLRNYTKSAYCRKNEVVKVFEELVKNAQFKYLFLSYNNEGLMTKEEVETIMKRYGHYQIKTKEYQRFKADKTENRNHKFDKTTEYLHILEKK